LVDFVADWMIGEGDKSVTSSVGGGSVERVPSGDQRSGGVQNGLRDAAVRSRWLFQRLSRAHPHCRRSTPPSLRSASDPPMTAVAAGGTLVFCASNVGADSPIASLRVERLGRGARLDVDTVGGCVMGISSDVKLTARPLTRATREAPLTWVVPASGATDCEQRRVVADGDELLAAQLATSSATCSELRHPTTGGGASTGSTGVEHN